MLQDHVGITRNWGRSQPVIFDVGFGIISTLGRSTRNVDVGWHIPS
jgi:hypothetical protein